MPNYNFIKVFDQNTADKLIKLGFQLIDSSNNIYTFLNTEKIQFSSEIDSSKVKYSNILHI